MSYVTHNVGKCPECGGVYSLRKTGRLRSHGYRACGFYATGDRCPGSGELPVSDGGEDRP